MDLEHSLNAIGLSLSIVGVALVWRFGWPQPTFAEHSTILLESDEGVEPARRQRAQYKQRSLVGFVLILAGFAAQLISALSPLLAVE